MRVAIYRPDPADPSSGEILQVVKGPREIVSQTMLALGAASFEVPAAIDVDTFDALYRTHRIDGGAFVPKDAAA